MTHTIAKGIAARSGLVSTALAVVLVCALPARADYEAGLRAWEARDAKTALAEWRAAAAAGDPRSMLSLGRLLVRGLGVPQDYVEAHMWLNLAAGRGDALAAVERELLAARMTAGQVAAAQQRASSWRPQAAAESLPASLASGTIFRDCAECPEMVLLPEGSFEMGSSPSEPERWDNEGPRHRVRIGYRFAVGRYEVTVGEFGRFAAATGHETTEPCWAGEDGTWRSNPDRSWRDPGFPQGNRDPVVCVSWDDALAYANWLRLESGEDYRLLTEAEWEYAARAQTPSPRYWDGGPDEQCQHANGADLALTRLSDGWNWGASCDDGAAHAATVGSYAPNDFGLHDMLGNVWEWVEDCWNDGYTDAPADGSARTSGDCSNRTARGSSWSNGPRFLRLAVRRGNETAARVDVYGFRVARTVD